MDENGDLTNTKFSTKSLVMIWLVRMFRVPGRNQHISSVCWWFFPNPIEKYAQVKLDNLPK